MPKYEGKPKVSPVRIAFETFVIMSLLSLMIDKEKIKVIGRTIALICGMLIWAYFYYTVSWFG